jgi:hypothetical protein
MFQVLQIVAVLLVAVAMTLALAHALELPGKLRLPKDHYLAVQSIYYPGFTIGGAAEPLGLLAALALLVMTPTGTAAFWLTASAFVALLAMHAAYWLLTHPVNSFWLEGTELTGAAAGFFAFDPLRQTGGRPDWTALRDRWEYSHVLRAGLAMLGLVLMVTAIVI